MVHRLSPSTVYYIVCIAVYYFIVILLATLHGLAYTELGICPQRLLHRKVSHCLADADEATFRSPIGATFDTQCGEDVVDSIDQMFA
jgi:hypothetical protein